eukprot:15336797-Ditylum_brightwellii.AAC.1
MKFSINNIGDPFITSNYGVYSCQFKCSAIKFFAKLWKIPKDEYWGYITICRTEGNLHGILLVHEHHPDGILYSSKETQYSVFKAGTLLLPLVAEAIDIIHATFYLGAASFVRLERFFAVNDVEVSFIGLPTGAALGLLLVPLTLVNGGAGALLTSAGGKK